MLSLVLGTNMEIVAAKNLFIFLKKNPSEEIYGKLMNADLVEMLCEASCTTNLVLLKYVLKCFFIFIECSQFYQQNRTAHTLESVIRALYILVKMKDENDILILGLQLVCDIICRLNSLKITLNTICNIPNVIALLRQLNDDSKKVPIGTEVMISLLHSQGIQKYKKLMEDAVSEELKSLVDIVKKHNDEKSIVIMSELLNGSIRFLVQPDIETAFDPDSRTFSHLVSQMKEVLVPFLIEKQDKLHETNLNVIRIVISALLSVYHYPASPITEEFSQYLVSKGFLNFLSILEEQSKSMELVIIIRSLLFELLRCLSNSVLGKENWENLLLPGLEALPPGATHKSIFIHDSSEVISIASIVFNYFYLLSSANPTVGPKFLNDLSSYISSLSQIPSASITKAVWLTFSVAYLSNSESFYHSKIAIIKLINFIMHYPIDEVYTHHPAILYWAFSDESVVLELQERTIKFWLDESDDVSNNELLTLLEINREACLVMMGLMASDQKLTFIIHKIMCSILTKLKFDTDYINEYAWAILPQHLAQFSSHMDPLHYECLTNVMKVCNILKSRKVEISLVLRISCLLPGAFAKYFKSIFSSEIKAMMALDSHHSAILQSTFSFIEILLLTSLEIKDQRVTSVYLNHEPFLNTVEVIITSNNELIDSSLMEFLTTLIKCQKSSHQKSFKIIHTDVVKIVKLLSGKPEISIATLKFLALYLEIISEKIVTPLINISLPNGNQLRALYLQIHMLCAKADENVLGYGWQCIRRLLDLSDSIGLKAHLSNIPYTSTLLLKTIETKAWKEVIAFLPSWLPNLPQYTPGALTIPNSLNALIKANEKLSKTTTNPYITKVLSKLLPKSINSIKKETEG